jgi:hypothetical protein
MAYVVVQERAPWWPWDNGRCHGQFVHFLLAYLASIYLAKTHIKTAQQKIIIARWLLPDVINALMPPALGIF